MPHRVYDALFICTGNSARSIMAEVILNHLGNNRFRAFSAGSHPRGQVHPLTIQVLAGQGYAMDGLRSKSWIEFAGPSAAAMDFIFTVCDQAAGEACPAWTRAADHGTLGVRRSCGSRWHPRATAQSVHQRAIEIVSRIRLLLGLPVDKLDRMSLQASLRELGEPQHAIR